MARKKSDPATPDYNALSDRQRRILQVIQDAVVLRGYPPSIREIGDAVGLTSTSSVAHQLRTLERKGFLRRDANRPRAVDVRGLDDNLVHSVEDGGGDGAPVGSDDKKSDSNGDDKGDDADKDA